MNRIDFSLEVDQLECKLDPKKLVDLDRIKLKK
jgi:hypothetical protein